MRTTLPPQQRTPSPKVEPVPPPIVLLPWKKRPLLLITPSAVSESVSLVMLGVPDALSTPPAPVPLAQPWPVPPLLRQGQAVPVPSPKQIGVPAGVSPTKVKPPQGEALNSKLDVALTTSTV